MRKSVGAWSLVVVLSGAFAAAGTSAARLRDDVITGREVVVFEEFQRTALDLAEENGISCETASKLLYDFAARNERRILAPDEWRYALLDGLYGLEVPQPAARGFLAAIAREVALPVDTGFLRSVRTVALPPGAVRAFTTGRGMCAPVPLARPAPRYTEAARAAGIEGTVAVRCVVLEDGSVANCRVVRSLGHGLDESVVLTIQNEWKFRPATRDGSPVAVEASFEVTMGL